MAAELVEMEDLSAINTTEEGQSASRGSERDGAGQETVVGDANTARRRRPRNEGRNREDNDEEEEMMYGAQHVIKLFVPVSLCMLVVVLTVASVAYYTDQSAGVYLIYTPLHPKEDASVLVQIGSSIGNALIVLGVVVVMTIFLVLLYKYKCYKVLHGWLILSSLLMMFIFSFIYMEALLKAYNLPFDMITLVIFIWNFGCMGMIAMHWKAPLRVLQAYHIVISALLALVFIKYLPEWTLWTILGVIALWDLVAVLCPHGPLRILVNIAHERNENIFPSLIYTSTVVYSIVGMADKETDEDSQEGTQRMAACSPSANAANSSERNPDSTPDRPLNQSSAWNRSNNGYGSEADRTNTTVQADGIEVENGAQQRPNRQQPRSDDEEDEEKGVKLGLGDFIFYSILVGKASSSGDWATTIAAYIAILMGLFFTLLLLATYKKALPALPISIAFGLVYTFATQYLISPFINSLAANQIFI